MKGSLRYDPGYHRRLAQYRIVCCTGVALALKYPPEDVLCASENSFESDTHQKGVFG